MSKAAEKLLSMYVTDDDDTMIFWEAMDLLATHRLWSGASAETLWKKRFEGDDPLDDILICETGHKRDARVNVKKLKVWLERRSHRRARRPKAVS